MFSDHNEVFDNNKTVTLNELQEHINDTQRQAQVLARKTKGKLDKCTYEKGYITQHVYACKTCTPPDTDAGFCLACSMTCHLDHDVIELWTRRNFCCDCGCSDKFTTKCALYDDDKRSMNASNVYNHNYRGRYCYCDKPYVVGEEMLKCFSCEDWFHLPCLKLKPTNKDANDDDEIDGRLYCRKCLLDKPMLQKLVNTTSATAIVESETKTNSSSTEQPPLKKQRSSVCVMNRDALSPDYDMLVNARIVVELCKCSDCEKLCDEYGFINDDVEDDDFDIGACDDVDDDEPLEESFSLEHLAMQRLLPVLSANINVRDVVAQFNEFTGKFRDSMLKWKQQNPNAVVTANIIETLTREAKSS